MKTHSSNLQRFFGIPKGGIQPKLEYLQRNKLVVQKLKLLVVVIVVAVVAIIIAIAFFLLAPNL